MRIVRALFVATSFLAGPGALAAMHMPMSGMLMSGQQPVRAATRPWREARSLWQQSMREGHRSGAQIGFRGRRVHIILVANAPRHPDMTFEAGGLTNPELVVTAGAQVTVTLLNMDKGPGMSHGFLVTTMPPPYPVVIPDTRETDIAQTLILAPRTSPHEQQARYAVGRARFRITRPGTYYYVCPVADHARAFHMYGRLIVTPPGHHAPH